MQGHSPRHTLGYGLAFFIYLVLSYNGAGFDPSFGDGVGAG
jgi:hypothetical protein